MAKTMKHWHQFFSLDVKKLSIKIADCRFHHLVELTLQQDNSSLDIFLKILFSTPGRGPASRRQVKNRLHVQNWRNIVKKRRTYYDLQSWTKFICSALMTSVNVETDSEIDFVIPFFIRSSKSPGTFFPL